MNLRDLEYFLAIAQLGSLAGLVEVVSRNEFNASASHPSQVSAGVRVHLRQMGMLLLRNRLFVGFISWL